jgi:hypothetical protein
MYNTKVDTPKWYNPLYVINIPMSIYCCYILDSNIEIFQVSECQERA